MAKIGDYQCVRPLKHWFKTSERPNKSLLKMDFYTELRSQCGICDYGWFKTSERSKKVHSKSNSTLNRDLNVESVTTAGSKQVRD